MSLNAQVLNTQHISIAQGLSSNRIYSIFQDSYGYLWIGTMNGLNRYDGYEFKVFKNELNNKRSINDNRIFKITEDKDHNIWIADWGGVSMYNRYNKTFKNYDLKKFQSGLSSTSPKAVDIFCDPGNNIWVGSLGNGLLKLDRKSDEFEKVLFDSTNPGSNNQSGNIVKGMCEYNGKLWVINWIHGLCFYDSAKGMLEPQNFSFAGKPDQKTNFEELGAYLYPDQNGLLWIITGSGIYKYDHKNNIMNVVKKFGKQKYGNAQYFPGLAQDADGNIWLGDVTTGLLKFEGVSPNYKEIYLEKHNDKNNPGKPEVAVSAICRDNSGIMWIGTLSKGIYKYDRSSEPFISYQYNPNNKNSLNGNFVLSLYQSPLNKSTIYIGTNSQGFNKFNTEQHKFVSIPINLKNNSGSIRSFLENSDGSLYLGTWGAGLYKYYKDGRLIPVLKNNPESTKSLSNNYISALNRDAKGQIWIGTRNGLNVYNPSTKKVERIYDIDSRLYPDSFMKLIRSKENSKSVLQSILKVGDSQNLTKDLTVNIPGNYLIVSAGEGMGSRSAVQFDYGWLENNKGDTVWSAKEYNKTFYLGGALKNRIFAGIVKLVPGLYHLRYISDDSHSYGHWNDTPPPDSALWGIQVIKLNEQEDNLAGNVLNKLKHQTLISGTDITAVHISPDGKIWIGTRSNGLTMSDPVSGKVKYYKSNPEKRNTISDNGVTDIYQRGNGSIWLTTKNGLDKLDPEKEKFSVYYTENGLPSNFLSSILEDDNGELWISSDNGISRMTTDKSTGKVLFINYDTRDGLSSTTFNQSAALKAADNKLYFGSDQGMVELSPSKFNSKPPEVQITNILLSNESVTAMGEDNPLKVPVMNAKKITLSSSQNDLSFDFTAFHFSHPDKNKYAHFLQGYDKSWNYDNRRFANYTNLDPGKYVFKVKAANSDGVWNDNGKSLTIIIMPPWWKTGWAYAGYILIFIGLLFSIDRFQRKRLLTKEREKQKINEAELRAQTAELRTKALEAESRALELENERKTKELEEARQLQLSLLPKQLPELPHLDIAVYMKTATEVGGDYYDFHLGLDGTLTVVLGDATGHGMKAGTMVTAAKSLFNSYASNSDIMYTFHEMSRCIKQMNFHMLSMCLAMLKISDHKLRMSSAGMPPVIIYRKGDRTVEEHVMKGMPLGAIDTFPYDVRETKLNTGDTLLMFSDGLPELHNEKKEMYGYKRVRNEFENVAEKNPADIIEHLKNSGSDWVNGKEPHDDVTFVVLKMK